MLFLKIADLYSNSPFAKLDADGLADIARTWAQEFRHVPMEAVPLLWERYKSKLSPTPDGLKASRFAPTSGELMAIWNDPDWDYWAEQNRVPDEPATNLYALATSEVFNRQTRANQIGHIVSAWQHEHMDAKGFMITCLCRHAKYGTTAVCTLTPDRKTWICETGMCEFRWPVGKPDPPNRSLSPGDRKAPVAEAEKGWSGESGEVRDVGIACGIEWDDLDRDQKNLFRHTVNAAFTCGLKLAEMSPETRESFAQWGVWFREKYQGTSFSYDLMQSTWPIWVEETQR